MQNTISEKKINRNLVEFTVAVVFAVLMLIAASFLMSFSIRNVRTDSLDSRISTETAMYADNIQRHIDSDFGLLRAMASFLEAADISGVSHSHLLNTEKIKSVLARARLYNDFLSIACYNTDGTGVRTVVSDKTVADIALDAMNESVRETVRRAFDGEEAQSEFFFSAEFGCMVSVRAVPLYSGGGIVGALTGTYSIQELTGIIAPSYTKDGSRRVFILDGGSGSVLSSAGGNASTEAAALPDGVGGLLTSAEEGFLSFSDGGGACRAYLKPLAGGNLRILYVAECPDTERETDYNAFLARVTLGVMCAIMILVVLIGYRLLTKYGKMLVRIIYFDELTGADNFTRFKTKLADECKEGGSPSLCVATLNIRRFKFINEVFGSAAADRLLIIIKNILEKSISAGEFFCREGNDIFHLCLFETDHAVITERLERVISSVKENLSKFYDYRLQMYAGVATFEKGEHALNTSEMLLHVSLAVASAKSDTTQSIYFYDENLHKKERTINYIETHMERALAEEDFKVYLQPKIDLQTGEVGGAEALVRWERNQKQLIFPDQFIPLFEKNGFCVKLDMFMFEQVCKLIRSWMDGDREPLPVSVNQSKLMFFEPNYVNDISGIAAKYGIPPGIITLEILEQLALENATEVNKKISLLRQKGFLVSMDDFGSGYSSFSAIGNLCIDELKLDRAFLLEATAKENWRTKIVIDQIVRMARRLHLSVVAEGVETQEDEILVKTLGCDYGQGYYYCRPIPAEEFTERYINTMEKFDPFER